MATHSITYVVRFRWWVKPALSVCNLMGVQTLPEWLRMAVARWGVVLTLSKDKGKDLRYGPSVHA